MGIRTECCGGLEVMMKSRGCEEIGQRLEKKNKKMFFSFGRPESCLVIGPKVKMHSFF